MDCLNWRKCAIIIESHEYENHDRISGKQGVRSYIDTVQREPVIITKQNRPVAVMLSMQDAEELFQYRVETGIEKGLLDVKQGRVSPFSPAFADELKQRFKA